jgi:hypothetical protein
MDVPMGHFVHDVLPMSSANLPTGHCEQVPRIAAEEKYPVVQGSHEVWLTSRWEKPAGHSMHVRSVTLSGVVVV